MEVNELKSIVESLLFVSGKPLKISQISKIVSADEEKIKKVIELLSADYENSGGLMIASVNDEIEIVTHPKNASFVEKLVNSEFQDDLSKAALEALCIIAYRGPITRPGVESIRGVNCTFTIRNLLMRGLIEKKENLKDARSYLYSVSSEFLKWLGISSVEKLPDYDKLSKDIRIDSVVNKVDN